MDTSLKLSHLLYEKTLDVPLALVLALVALLAPLKSPIGFHPPTSLLAVAINL